MIVYACDPTGYGRFYRITKHHCKGMTNEEKHHFFFKTIPRLNKLAHEEPDRPNWSEADRLRVRVIRTEAPLPQSEEELVGFIQSKTVIKPRPTKEAEPAFVLEVSHNKGKTWSRIAGGIDRRSMDRLLIEQKFDGLRRYRIRETPDKIVWSYTP